MVKRKRKLEILFEGEVEIKEKISKIEEREEENDFEEDIKGGVLYENTMTS